MGLCPSTNKYLARFLAALCGEMFGGGKCLVPRNCYIRPQSGGKGDLLGEGNPLNFPRPPCWCLFWSQNITFSTFYL